MIAAMGRRPGETLRSGTDSVRFVALPSTAPETTVTFEAPFWPGSDRLVLFGTANDRSGPPQKQGRKCHRFWGPSMAVPVHDSNGERQLG